jgi:hypothetical protein
MTETRPRTLTLLVAQGAYMSGHLLGQHIAGLDARL